MTDSRPAFQDHFSGVAERYERYRPTYPEALFRHLVAHVGADAMVWEVAAGSGQASRGLAAVFSKLLVTDGSGPQLARARLEGVLRAVCLADRAPLRDASVDLVAVAQALHWLPLGAFFDEVARVARPGACLAVWTYRLPDLGRDLDDALRHFAREEVEPYWPADRGHVEKGYGTIAFPFPEVPAPTFEAAATMDVDDFLGYVGTWSAVRRAREATKRDPLDDFAPEWRRLWGDEATTREVRWPITLRMFDVT